MFAKIFGQIFDSSIAEDYNCRRMFMDLLVLSDPTGAVDMTLEAISRRTNVPIEEVGKYIKELCQPDAKSRSKLEEGKRLIPLDSNRDWGWQIVNYQHYRQLKDQEALRLYFRDAQRRNRQKKKRVKDRGLTELNKNGQSLTSPSSSTSASVYWEELKRNPLYEGIEIEREFEKAKQWCQKKGRRCTSRFFENWLKKADRILATPVPKSKFLPPAHVPTKEEQEKAKQIANQAVEKLREQFKMPS